MGERLFWEFVGVYFIGQILVHWRLNRLEVWRDGHDLDHADDEVLLTQVNGSASQRSSESASGT